MDDDGMLGATTKVLSINEVVCFAGEPGCGKTDAAIRYVLDWQARRTCYVLAVDPNHDMPGKLHDARPTGIVRYRSLAEARQGLVARPGGIHAITTDNASPVLRFAMDELAPSTFTAPDKKGDRYGVPVIVLIDEMSIYEEASEGKRIGETLKLLLTQRRHKHVVLVYGTQSARDVQYKVFGRTNVFYLFRTEDDEDRARLRRGGVRAAIVDKLRDLPEHKSLCYRRGG